jgi:NitT/TauT family transport system permease protein
VQNSKPPAFCKFRNQKGENRMKKKILDFLKLMNNTFFVIKKPLPLGWRVFFGMASFAMVLGCYNYMSHKQHLKNPDSTIIPNLNQLKEGVIIIFQRQFDDIIIDDGSLFEEENVESNSKGIKKYFTAVIEFFKHPRDRWIVEDSIATGKRLFVGFGIAIAVSLVIGVLMGCFGFVEAFFDPPFTFLAKIPPTAMVAVFFVLAGLGPKMFILNLVFGILPSLSKSISLSVKNITLEYHYKLRTLGSTRFEEIYELVLHDILPRFLEDVKLQFGPAVVYLIASELNLADIGFGYRIRIHYKLASMNIVFPYLIILGIFGLLVEFCITNLSKRLCRWYYLEGS